jgi:hypothetical protein
MLIGLAIGVRVEMAYQETKQQRRDKLRDEWLETGTPIDAQLAHEWGRGVGPA